MCALKGIKVTDADRKLRIGIAAKSLDDLKTKTIDKWNLKLKKSQFSYQLPDGTSVNSEEYFKTLESQTLLVWVQVGKYAETDAEILYKTIREVNDDFLSAGEKVQEFFTEKMKTKVYKLAAIMKNIESTKKTAYSSRKEHPEWFEGLDTRSKTKEEYMYRRSQDRIRSYYYKTKEELLRHELPNEELQELLIELKIKLKRVDSYGCYFDRSKHCTQEMRCICDPTGVFICQGRWDKTECMYNPRHNINPYSSREERIMFQTWNLDHKRERARTVIPAIARALKEIDEHHYEHKREEIKIVYDRIFTDLFTTENLKLVHIICHDKSSHLTAEVGSYF